MCERHARDVRGFSADAMAALERYDWPGNVRELENTVERLVIMSENGQRVGLELLAPHSRGDASQRVDSSAGRRGLPLAWPDAGDDLVRAMQQAWSGNHDALVDAARRYGADGVLVGRARQTPAGTYDVEWSFTASGASGGASGDLEAGPALAAERYAGIYASQGASQRSEQCDHAHPWRLCCPRHRGHSDQALHDSNERTHQGHSRHGGGRGKLHVHLCNRTTNVIMRQVFVYRNGKIVPKDTAAPLNSGVFHVMSDIAPFVTQDGTPIGSRSTLRAYEQRTGTRQIGNDFASLAAKLRGEA
jgi:hypothetical protein